MDQPATDPVFPHHGVRTLLLDHSFARSSRLLDRPLVYAHSLPLAHLSTC